jgi:hypothetical protein
MKWVLIVVGKVQGAWRSCFPEACSYSRSSSQYATTWCLVSMSLYITPFPLSVPTTGNSGSPSITNMRPAILLSLGAASLVAAIPPANKMAPTDKGFRIDPDLRLIKTSELDPGVWVTEEEKIVNYVSKKIGFIDITDITNATTLERLSTPQSELQSRAVAAVAYPSTLTHQTQANGFIASLSQTKPKAWLTTLTKYVTLLINLLRRDSG